MLKLFFFLLLLLQVERAVAQAGFVIRANISGFADGTKFYLQDRELGTLMDSVLIKKNKFQITGQMGDFPKLLALAALAGKEVYRYDFLFIGNESVTVTGDKSNFNFLSVKGSRYHVVYQKHYDKVLHWYKRRQDLFDMVMQQSNDTSAASRAWCETFYKEAVLPIDSITDSLQMAFVKSHLNSFAALHELTYCKRLFPKDTLRKMYDRLEAPYKESPDARRLLAFLEVGDPVKEGDVAFNFEAFDTAGKKHELFDIKGKYILLDFTQAHCAPCIHSVKELKKMNTLYADKLAIVSFSTDMDKEVWRKSVRRDKPSWVSLWDGNGTFARPALKYGVTGYPTFVLIDPNGKIVWKGTGWGEGMFTGMLPRLLK
jgi:thiol-disulfide isomerase/thioredoxin